MHRILEKIVALRDGRPLTVDRSNTNRYCLIATEENGAQTAYCSSAPLYNEQTGKLLDLCFTADRETVTATGSNAAIRLTDRASLQNENGACTLSLPARVALMDRHTACSGDVLLHPTANGLFFQTLCYDGKTASYVLHVEKPYLPIRANGQCFALMQKDLVPFMTVSCIGAVNAAGEVIAPATLCYQKQSENDFVISFETASPFAAAVTFEWNLYVPKLLQDTTVESAHPGINNAFGGMAFIGNTASFGEEWLYLRLDYAKLATLQGRRVRRAVLHFPEYTHGGAALRACRVSQRFCSFGSNWNNKISPAMSAVDATAHAGWQSLPVTDLIIHPATGLLYPSEGLILRTQVKDSGFSAIATGDNYYTPPVLEISFT